MQNAPQINWNPMRLPNHNNYGIPQMNKKIDIPPGKHLQSCGGKYSNLINKWPIFQLKLTFFFLQFI